VCENLGNVGSPTQLCHRGVFGRWVVYLILLFDLFVLSYVRFGFDFDFAFVLSLLIKARM